MFFDSIPNFLYPDFKNSDKYKLSKNIFRRVRARDSFNAVYSSSRSYTIQDGETPNSIAYNEFGDSEWYWTILILNNITDMNTMWPMSLTDLDKFIQIKYGEYENKPRHWETTRVKDSKQNIVIPEGIIVEMFQDKPGQDSVNYVPQIFVENRKYLSEKSEKLSTTIKLGDVENLLVNDVLDLQYNTKISSIDIPNKTITLSRPLDFSIFPGYSIKFSRYENWSKLYVDSVIKDDTGKVTSTSTKLATYQTLRMITNREYEYEINELKKEIKLPRSKYLEMLKKELEDLMAYDTTYKITQEGYRISESAR